MANRIVVDPITRIEGHLRAEVEITDGTIRDAFLSSTMVRGLENEYKIKQQEEAKNLEAYWNNVNSVITNGKLKDINIPNAEKEDFFKYLAVPINSKGESQEMIDAEKEDEEDRLLLSYLRFKKFNLNDLVNLKAKTNRLEQLRSRVGIPNPKIENAQARTNGGQQGSPNSFPTLDQITNIN